MAFLIHSRSRSTERHRSSGDGRATYLDSLQWLLNAYFNITMHVTVGLEDFIEQANSRSGGLENATSRSDPELYFSCHANQPYEAKVGSTVSTIPNARG
jgi:hypothetical protein